MYQQCYNNNNVALKQCYKQRKRAVIFLWIGKTMFFLNITIKLFQYRILNEFYFTCNETEFK